MSPSDLGEYVEKVNERASSEASLAAVRGSRYSLPWETMDL
jgi:hypothetical protein